MKMQNVTTIETIEPKGIVEDNIVNPTYIMQGRADKKALDIYHLILAPTYGCNLRCKHCYLSEHTPNTLPRDIVLRLVEEWNEIVLEERGEYGGIFHIKGGEPFVVPYLWDILDRVAEIRTLRLMLTTNGTFVDEKIFKKLSGYKDALDGHLTVIVSLDGATGETDAKIRGDGHYAKALRFLQGLRKCDINFYLNCVLHKGNIDELSAYIRLAKEYGASQVNFLNFIPRGNGSNLRDWQLPHLDLYETLEELYKSGDGQTKIMLAGSLPEIKYQETCKSCPTSGECVAAYRGLLYITPDGYVFTCPNTTYPDTCLGNILNQSLREIMENVKELYGRLKAKSGAYICTGEKMLYEREEDIPCLKSLHGLQDSPDKIGLTYKTNPLSMSYCFNRNW